ncbi:Fc.00g025840.m01.CDS01 [Cosmosporella sp. VM-42]
MKLLATLTSATVAGAFVLPDFDIFHRPIPATVAALGKKVEFLSSEAANAVHTVKDTAKEEFEHIFNQQLSGGDASAITDIDIQQHDFSNYTIYQLISESNYTTNFSRIVDKYDSVVKMLNDTDSEYTLFAPIDSAFEDIPKHHDKPSKEFVESLLNYHIGSGSYPAGKILTTHTLPTELHESFLGGEPQRLRTSVGLSGVRINVYSKVVAVNIKAKNGYIHAVNKILIPPTFIGRELSFFPAQFSTLILAYEKTDFVKFIHNVNTIGSTVFAPSNNAWVRLGFKANAFLFNTELGKKYLKALLKYQIVANTTVYSDKIYYGDDKDEQQATTDGHLHIELPTLLEGKSLGLDIHSWKGWTSMIVNGYVKVGFQDGVAKNGVVQVVQEVPIPPCRKGSEQSEHRSGEIEVEDLKQRLDAFIDDVEDEAETFYGEL